MDAVRGRCRAHLAGRYSQDGAVGPDAARAAEAIAEYVDAGFDEIYIAQMGPDQDSGIHFLAEEVLPLLITRT